MRLANRAYVASDPGAAQVVELNLLLADWYDENHRQSLLCRTNAKLAREMLNNVRCASSPSALRSKPKLEP